MRHVTIRRIEEVLRSYSEELRQTEQPENIIRIAKEIYIEALDLEHEIEWRRYYHHEIFRQLEDINKKQNDFDSSIKEISSTLGDGILREIRSIGHSCPLIGSQSSNGPIELIVNGGPSTTAKERGKNQADEALSDWLRDAVEVVAIDPFLFKREKTHGHSETAEETAKYDVDYADALLDIFGTNRAIKFIYKGNPSKNEGGPTKVSQGVANRIADQLATKKLKVTFHVVEDLHDRVWLKRDAKERWHGKVIGTSRGGIGRRPTYIIDMTQSDVSNYHPYVTHLISASQQSHERPIDFKKARPRRPHSK
jgi:hypothetical protein